MKSQQRHLQPQIKPHNFLRGLPVVTMNPKHRGFRLVKTKYAQGIEARQHSGHRTCPQGCPGIAMATSIEGALLESRFIKKALTGQMIMEEPDLYSVLELGFSGDLRLLDVGEMVGKGKASPSIEMCLEERYEKDAHPFVRQVHQDLIETRLIDGLLTRSRLCTRGANITVYASAIGKVIVERVRPLKEHAEALLALIDISRSRSQLELI